MDTNEIKAEAVQGFVKLMCDAFMTGFIECNYLTLQELHRIAQNHIKDAYGIDAPNILEEYGRKGAIELGLNVDE